MGDVLEELVGAPKVRNLLGDLGTLALDERDSASAVTPGEFLDLGERQPRLLTDLDHPGLADRLVVVGTVPRREPARPQQPDILPVPQDVCGDRERGRRVADPLAGVGHDFPFTSGRPEVLAWHTCRVQ